MRVDNLHPHRVDSLDLMGYGANAPLAVCLRKDLMVGAAAFLFGLGAGWNAGNDGELPDEIQPLGCGTAGQCIQAI